MEGSALIRTAANLATRPASTWPAAPPGPSTVGVALSIGPNGRSFVGRMKSPLLVVASVLAATAALVGPTASTAASAAAPASRFVPIVPCRLADTRPLGGPVAELRVTTDELAACAVPRNASAAAMTATVTEATAAGYATVHPAGAAQPATSTVNFSAWETRANGSLIGIDGGIRVAIAPAGTRAHVVVDVTGYFVPAATATAGRFVPVTPTRLVDTRSGGVVERLVVDAPAGAAAVSLNVTITQNRRAGFVSVYPSGAQRPATSAVNTDAAGQTRAAGVVVPVGSDGKVVVEQVHADGHLLVDLTGWFTGAGAPEAADGLFVPITPHRALDTRTLGGDARGWLAPGGSVAIDLSGLPAAATAAAIAANVAMVAGHAGFLVVAAAGEQDAVTTSSVNSSGEPAVANLVLTPVDGARRAAVRSSHGADVIVDVTGVFTGTPSSGPGACCDPGTWPVPDSPARQIARTLLPGDVFAFLERRGVGWEVDPSRSGYSAATYGGRSNGGCFATILVSPTLVNPTGMGVTLTRHLLAHEAAHAIAIFAGACAEPGLPAPDLTSVPGYRFVGLETECVPDLFADVVVGQFPSNMRSVYDAQCGGHSTAARMTPGRQVYVDWLLAVVAHG